LGALGIALDAERNNTRGKAEISSEHSPVVVRVIPPAEDLIIVNHVVRLLQMDERRGQLLSDVSSTQTVAQVGL
jgi:acetate kinase